MIDKIHLYFRCYAKPDIGHDDTLKNTHNGTQEEKAKDRQSNPYYHIMPFAYEHNVKHRLQHVAERPDRATLDDHAKCRNQHPKKMSFHVIAPQSTE